MPKGPLVQGYGSGCAREYGLLPPPQPRLQRTGQDGPNLLDLLADVTPPHTSHVSDGQAECTERDRDRGMMTSSGNTADTDGDITPAAEPTPRIAILERYPPRVCAGPDCAVPPHVRWVVLNGGLLFGRYWRTGDHIHLCDTHEREVVHLTGSDWDDEPTPARVPAQREVAGE